MSWDADVIPAPTWAADRETNPKWRANAALGYALELAGRLERDDVPALAEVVARVEAAVAQLRERVEDLAKAPDPIPELDYDMLARAILRVAGAGSG